MDNIIEQLTKKTQPLTCTTERDEFIKASEKSFDCMFNGVSEFYPWSTPKNLPKKFSIGVIYGSSGCLGLGTKVLMYDGTFKSVENINTKDKLMGPDSKPRNVLNLFRGVEQMYWIRQDNGIDYRVNGNHILSLKDGSSSDGKVVNITVNEFINKDEYFKIKYKGYKSIISHNLDEISSSNQDIKIEITGIKVERDIIDYYYGFGLDGDNLFLLEDFTVTHNSGKSTLLKEFGDEYDPVWEDGKAIVSHFETPSIAINKLGAVGLNTIPSWYKPYNVLSNGERFRADLARRIKDNAVIDEFTSVVDRNVAKAASFALSKYVSNNNINNIVISTCHEDVIDWLEPDWVINTDSGEVYDGFFLSDRKSISKYTRQIAISGRCLRTIII